MMDSSGTDEYISYVVSTYTDMLFKIAFSALHDRADAQDVVQDVFIKLISKKPLFNSREHEKAWLIRVTLNMSRNLLKKRKRECPVELTLSDKDSYSTETAGEVIEAVMSLDEKYSTVIHLYYYEDFSIAQIAKILRIPCATVGTRLSRARAALKTILKGDES